jgi:multidrug resistance efflux pump
MNPQAKAQGRFDVRRMSWKRLTGLACVTAILVGALYYIGDNTLVLKADGLVLRDRQAAAAPYEARIRQIFVHSGDYVRAGEKIATLESLSMSRNLAELAAQRARLTSTVAHLEARRTVVDAMLPIARANASRVQAMVAELEQARDRGMTSFVHLQQVTAEAYTAGEHLASLQAEGTSSDEELRQNRSALAEMNAAYENLKSMYADGELLTPASGFVGTSIMDTGEVLVPGKKVLEIFTGTPFVLAYLPDSSFVDVEEGEQVRVSSAGKSIRAIVEKILPLAEALPPEFQRPVRARDRGQLLRIALTDAQAFVTEQKVRITGCYLADCEDLASTGRKLGRQMTDRMRQGYAAALRLIARRGETVEAMITAAYPKALRRAGQRIETAEAFASRISACVEQVPGSLRRSDRQRLAFGETETTSESQWPTNRGPLLRIPLADVQAFVAKKKIGSNGCYIAACDDAACTIAGCNDSSAGADGRPAQVGIREGYAAALRRVGHHIETIESVAGQISACVRGAYRSPRRIDDRSASAEPARSQGGQLVQTDVEPGRF